MIQPDKDKLLKVVKAYNNSDPEVSLENQGYLYIVSGLLEFFEHDASQVYWFFHTIMFKFNWRHNYLLENVGDKNPRVEDIH